MNEFDWCWSYIYVHLIITIIHDWVSEILGRVIHGSLLEELLEESLLLLLRQLLRLVVIKYPQEYFDCDKALLGDRILLSISLIDIVVLESMTRGRFEAEFSFPATKSLVTSISGHYGVTST